MITIFISWLGNSSFLIKTSIGKRILIDPINKFHSCKIENFNPNIITLSSNDFKCDCITNLSQDIKLISEKGEFNTDLGIIKGISSFNDNLNGLKRGKNTIFIYNIDGLKICHLGYLGHILDYDTLELLKNCHILFLPIGSNITLNGKTAFKLAKKINPKIIIPMNYKYNSYSFIFKGPEEFLLLSQNITRIKDDSFFINKDKLEKHFSEDMNTVLISPIKVNNII